MIFKYYNYNNRLKIIAETQSYTENTGNRAQSPYNKIELINKRVVKIC